MPKKCIFGNFIAGETTIVVGNEYPRRWYAQRPKYERQWTMTKVSVEAILGFHLRLHPRTNIDDWRNVILSDDGIPESKSSSISFDCVSILFVGCRNIYPLRIVRPERGNKVALKVVYQELVRQLNALELRVVHVVADAPKRAQLRRIVRFNGKHGCDLCLCSSKQLKNRDQRTRGPRVYPVETCLNKPFRDHDYMDKKTRGLAAEVSDKVRAELPQGIIGRSPLVYLTSFNIVWDICIDPMQMLDRGICMRLLECLFNVPTPNRSKFARLSLAGIDSILLGTKVPMEFTRRTRAFDFTHWKGTYSTLFHTIHTLQSYAPISFQRLNFVISSYPFSRASSIAREKMTPPTT